MINIRNEIGASITYPTAIRTIGEYYIQQHAHKLDNSGEISSSKNLTKKTEII